MDNDNDKDNSDDDDDDDDDKFAPIPDLGTRLDLFRRAVAAGLWRDALHFYLQTVGGKCLRMVLTLAAVVATGALFLKCHPAERRLRRSAYYYDDDDGGGAVVDEDEDPLTWVDAFYFAVVTST